MLTNTFDNLFLLTLLLSHNTQAEQPEALENLKKLHLSQLKAYENAARICLKRIANEYIAPPIEEKADTNSDKTPIVKKIEQNNYIEKCIKEASHLSKGWKVDKIIVNECLLNEIRDKASKYLYERRQDNDINEADNDEKIEKLNMKMLKSSEEKLPTIDECEENNGDAQDRDTQSCVEDGEITSEEENDDGSKSSQNENSSKNIAKQDIDTSKSKTQKPKTKISLLKVNQKKRQLNSQGQSKLKKVKMINGNSNSNNGTMNNASSTQGKRGRGSKGRGRQWRRGGKN